MADSDLMFGPPLVGSEDDGYAETPAYKPVRVSPWPFVYRVVWYSADPEHGNKSWTRRVTKKGAEDWQEIFESNREYRLSQDRPWYDRLVIERAPVGDWERVYDGS